MQLAAIHAEAKASEPSAPVIAARTCRPARAERVTGFFGSPAFPLPPLLPPSPNPLPILERERERERACR